MRFIKRKSIKSKYHLSLDDGQSVQGVFVGDPVAFEYQGKNDEDSKFRFMANFILKENGAMTCKIVETGWLLYKAMEEMNDEFNLEKHRVKVKREGVKMETRWSLMPVKSGELSKAELMMLKKIDLHDLKAMVELRKGCTVLDLGETAGDTSTEEGPAW